MPKRIEGVSVRLMECAKEEFLLYGFQAASIRTIAQKANTSPRAVYTRFPNKEGLFAAIVEPVISEFIDKFQDYSNDFWEKQNEHQKKSYIGAESIDFYMTLVDYTFDYADIFKLVLKRSEGTKYADFIEKLTIINCNYIFNHFKNNKPKDSETMKKLVHILTHSFYSGMFEPLLHNMSRDEAHFFVCKLCNFFIFGVQGLIME